LVADEEFAAALNCTLHAGTICSTISGRFDDGDASPLTKRKGSQPSARMYKMSETECLTVLEAVSSGYVPETKILSLSVLGSKYAFRAILCHQKW
jgi:hypothetical protein